MEFSSIYASFGSEVTILQDGDVFLPREDEEIAAAVKASLEARGIRVMTGIKVQSVKQAQGMAVVTVEGRMAGDRTAEGGAEEHRVREQKLEGEAVLVAAGRSRC